MSDSGFKLVAIRPLPGCSKRFLKNLKPGIVYKFYQEYKYLDNIGNDISKFTNSSQIEGSNEWFYLNEKNYLTTISCNVAITPSTIFEHTPINLYSIKSGPKINFSAIVGENGSGKSSIIDFHNLIIYYLSSKKLNKLNPISDDTKKKIFQLLNFTKKFLNKTFDFISPDFKETLQFAIENNVDQKPLKHQLIKLIDNLSSPILYVLLDIEKIISKEANTFQFIKHIESHENEFYRLNDFQTDRTNYTTRNKLFNLIEIIKNKAIELNNELIKNESFDDDIQNKFNFELYYTDGISIHTISKRDDCTIMGDSEIYYSILLNYSLHSLNEENSGAWLKKLFHKNDGYQTPLVINPYRKKGNIDVNKEIALSTSRIHTNILRQLINNRESLLLGKYRFHKFLLTMKVKEYYRYDSITNINSFSKITDLLNHFIEHPYNFNIDFEYRPTIRDYCIYYIQSKFQKISSTYIHHFYHYYDDDQKLPFEKRLDQLQKWQKSQAVNYISFYNNHVTSKIRKAFNFIKNYDKLISKLDFISNMNSKDTVELTVEQLCDWINLIKEHLPIENQNTNDILENLIPSFFDIDIEFLVDNNHIRFSDLSSGEQQYIFNINTITYHISNIQTIESVLDTKISKYNNINIILDEIELYYHPQFQRTFIKDLIYEINKISNKESNFNFILLSHSPFILSDIPSQNVLKMRGGIPQLNDNKKNSFASNMHELLNDEFFLGEGTMGAFAKDYIENLVLSIKKLTKQSSKKKIDKLAQQISIIGEDLIRYSLEDLIIERIGYLYPQNVNVIALDILKKRLKELDPNISIK